MIDASLLSQLGDSENFGSAKTTSIPLFLRGSTQSSLSFTSLVLPRPPITMSESLSPMAVDKRMSRIQKSLAGVYSLRPMLPLQIRQMSCRSPPADSPQIDLANLPAGLTPITLNHLRSQLSNSFRARTYNHSQLVARWFAMTVPALELVPDSPQLKLSIL